MLRRQAYQSILVITHTELFFSFFNLLAQLWAEILVHWILWEPLDKTTVDTCFIVSCVPCSLSCCSVYQSLLQRRHWTAMSGHIQAWNLTAASSAARASYRPHSYELIFSITLVSTKLSVRKRFSAESINSSHKIDPLLLQERTAIHVSTVARLSIVGPASSCTSSMFMREPSHTNVNSVPRPLCARKILHVTQCCTLGSKVGTL